MVLLLPCSMTHPICRWSLRPDSPNSPGLTWCFLVPSYPSALESPTSGLHHIQLKETPTLYPPLNMQAPAVPMCWGQRHQKQHLNLNSSPLPGLILSIPEVSGWERRGGHIVLQILPHPFSPSLFSPRSDTEHSQHSSGSPIFPFIFEVVVTSPGETGPEKLILSQQCEIIRRLLHFPLIEIHMLTKN